jgi:hypothetical protein
MILPPMSHKQSCEELNRIKLEAISALHSARNTRRSRDLSFHEDVEITRAEHNKIDALVKHLLAGHDGDPCPAGDRPIIGIAPHPNAQPLARDQAQQPLRAPALLQRRQ